jgi:hypothetical protein
MRIEDNSSASEQECEESFALGKKISYKDFKNLFNFEENDRDKKELKRDYKKLSKQHSCIVKFKHLIGIPSKPNY